MLERIWLGVLTVAVLLWAATLIMAQQSSARRYAEQEYEFLDPIDCIYKRSTAFSTVYNEWAGRMQKNIVDRKLMADLSDHFARLEACPAWPVEESEDK